MDSTVRIDGLRELRRGLNAAEKGAARELNKALKLAATREILPIAKRDTPVGATGSLRAADKVTTKGDRVVFRNAKPQANTIHWGRKTLTRGGKTFPSVVKPHPYFYATVIREQGRIVDVVFREVERFVARQVP